MRMPPWRSRSAASARSLLNGYSGAVFGRVRWAFDASTLRSVTLFRRGLRSKARDFNWHNVIGLWSWGPLVVVA